MLLFLAIFILLLSVPYYTFGNINSHNLFFISEVIFSLSFLPYVSLSSPLCPLLPTILPLSLSFVLSSYRYYFMFLYVHFYSEIFKF